MSGADQHDRCADCPAAPDYCPDHTMLSSNVNRIIGGTLVVSAVFGMGFFLLHERIAAVEAKVEKTMEVKEAVSEIRYNLKALMTDQGVEYIEDRTR